MGRGEKRSLMNVDVVVNFFNNVMLEKKPYLPLLIPLILIFWALERWIFSLSNWVPLVLAVWATIQYGNYQHRIAIEDLNKKWKRVTLINSKITPLEHCEWLNKLLMEIWSNYMNPKLSFRFHSIVEKRLKHHKSRLIERVELLEFSLGSSPPGLGLHGTRWSTFGDQRVMHLGFDWDTSDLSIMLLAKVAKPFFGTAKIVINSLHIKGDLLLMPILGGKVVLYSFISTPEVRITVAFGSGGSQSLPATELPGVSSWLIKLLTDTLAKMMVEPRRQCFSLPAVDLRKQAVGGIVYVTVLSAAKLSRSSLRGSPSRKQPSSGVDGLQEHIDDKDLQTFVEVELGELTRRTHVRLGSGPQWNSTFNMVLHDNTGIVRFHLYEHTPGSMTCNYLASCEIKMRYVADDSTMFWAIGPDSSVIARHSEFCGKDVEMVLPFEGVNAGELAVKLVVKEWQFSDGSLSFNNLRVSSQPSLSGSSNFLLRTGRRISVTIVEGKDLITKDESGKCNPYVKLQYGKVLQKTKTAHSFNPAWNQKFEFDEIRDGEYLKIKCYTEEVSGDDSNGSARINLEGLVEGSPRDVWIPLENVNSGELRLQIEAVRMDDYEGSRGSAYYGNGLIELVLIEARDLVAADLRGTSDPYVRVQYGNLKRRTKVMYKTLNPKWHQTLEFPDDGSPLELHVKDHNALLPTSNIGDCVVEYQGLPPNEMADKWIPLQGVKRGEIHVQVTRKVPELEKRPSLDPEPSLTKAHQISSQMKQMMIKLESLIEDGNPDGMSAPLSELESLQDMQEEYMVQLETEQMLLLNKIKELGQEISNSSPPLS
ncbi:synaptotagmin-5-like [Hibiscus syriacus]|uniref:synaptotagmin-5-like n=1 Tax=Hibiscus syriacus TaxID=106335 RepID=UPI001923A449|nr:synaptotagmin-5-like [Hibiscus syriacus]